MIMKGAAQMQGKRPTPPKTAQSNLTGNTMNRRNLMTGAAIAAVSVAAPAMAQKTPCPGPSEATLNAAGSAWLIAYSEHGADGLRQLLAAIAIQASGGC